jgi:DNA-binding MarR family transcriptional regulator
MNTTSFTNAGSPQAGGPIRDAADERLNLLICRIYSKLAASSGPVLRTLGISIHASQVMIALVESGSMTVGDLSRHIAVDLSTVSHVLRRLENDGLVQRVREKKDNRVVIATLTKTGAAMATKCRKMALQHEELMLHSISRDERDKFKRMLGQVFENEIAAEVGGALTAENIQKGA